MRGGLNRRVIYKAAYSSVIEKRSFIKAESCKIGGLEGDHCIEQL